MSPDASGSITPWQGVTVVMLTLMPAIKAPVQGSGVVDLDIGAPDVGDVHGFDVAVPLDQPWFEFMTRTVMLTLVMLSLTLPPRRPAVRCARPAVPRG